MMSDIDFDIKFGSCMSVVLAFNTNILSDCCIFTWSANKCSNKLFILCHFPQLSFKVNVLKCQIKMFYWGSETHYFYTALLTKCVSLDRSNMQLKKEKKNVINAHQTGKQQALNCCIVSDWTESLNYFWTDKSSVSDGDWKLHFKTNQTSFNINPRHTPSHSGRFI